MKIAMAQMSMTEDMARNEQKILSFCDQAAGSDLLFFPEVQYTPFFARYEHRDADRYLIKPDDERIARIAAKAREHGMYLSPNVYMEQPDGKYDTSLWIDKSGEVAGISTMVHIFRGKGFYETDYYTPSRDGFHVYETEYGKVGIVICFDRHMPESIRSCAAMGADLVIVPTANMTSEPMELFEWEMRTQAMQNRVFIAMCNRVGVEDGVEFAGESLVVHPSGELLRKADGAEQLITCDVDLSEAAEWKRRFPFLSLRRPEFYR